MSRASSPDLTALQEAVLAAGRHLLDTGLTVGTYGNISIRAGDRMVITPTGADRGKLTSADIPIVDIATGEWTGPQPSGERALHLAIYRTRPEAGAVMHAHSPNACTVAAAQRELPVVTAALERLVGPSVRVAPHAITGTRKLERVALAALEDRRAAMLANHGAVCIGRDLDEAILCLESLERACRAFIDSEFARATHHTGPVDPRAIREAFVRTFSIV